MKPFGRRSPVKEPDMKVEGAQDLNRIFVEEGHLIDEALKKGVRDAILRHKKEGLPVVICRDGKAVLVRPEEFDA
jgi:hypothetical protein